MRTGRAFDVFAEDDGGIFAVQFGGIATGKARNLGHRAAVTLFGRRDVDDGPGFAKRHHRLKPRGRDALRGKIGHDGARPAQAEGIVIGVRADQIGMAVNPEADLGELADPGGLTIQRRHGGGAEVRAVEGEGDGRCHLGLKAATDGQGGVTFGHRHGVDHGGLAEVALIDLGARFSQKRGLVAGGQGHGGEDRDDQCGAK